MPRKNLQKYVTGMKAIDRTCPNDQESARGGMRHGRRAAHRSCRHQPVLWKEDEWSATWRINKAQEILHSLLVLTEPRLLGGNPAVHPQAIREIRNGCDEVHHNQHRPLELSCGDGTDIPPAGLERREIDRTRHVPRFVEREAMISASGCRAGKVSSNELSQKGEHRRI